MLLRRLKPQEALELSRPFVLGVVKKSEVDRRTNGQGTATGYYLAVLATARVLASFGVVYLNSLKSLGKFPPCETKHAEKKHKVACRCAMFVDRICRLVRHGFGLRPDASHGYKKNFAFSTRETVSFAVE